MINKPLIIIYINVIFCFILFIKVTFGAREPLVRVIVSGIQGEVLENVQAALKIPEGMVSAEEVNLSWLERFRQQVPEKAQQALEPYGYYNSRVTAELENPAGKGYVLRVHVEAGPPVIVTEAEVTIRGPGEKEKQLSDLVKSFSPKKGDVLRQDIYEKSKGALKARALELGYLDSDFPVHQILVSSGRSAARIELALDTGPQYFFGKVTFEGAGNYPESFLRRYMAFKEGEVFSYAKMSKTQLNLINSERFQDVVISPEKEESKDLRVPVTVRLEPSLPKRLRIGGGYGTDTGPRITIHYRDLNVFKRGHEFNAELDVAQRLQGFVAGYSMPGKDINRSTGILFKLLREDVTTYLTKLVSIEFDKTRGFGQGKVGTAYLRFQMEDSTVGIAKVHARLVLPGVRFTQQKYDNLIRPRKGFRYGVEVLGTDRFLGSNVTMVQAVAEGHILVPLPWRLSLLARATGGVTFVKEDFDKMPASLRFFAGGDRSVRGYGYQTLGPKDSEGNVVGGKNLAVGSLELERAILQDWGVAVFYDAGNAFNSLTDLTIFQGAGAGVRYYTKVGAIRLDLAHQINVPHPGFRVHFNFGLEL